MSWQPKITWQHIQARADFTQRIRSFFASQQITEVQTPLINACSVTDPYIESISTSHGFLQTSPEYAMKRLLALHKQSIYQICKAFRKEDTSSWHANEFTMLEWYVVNASMQQLMDQVAELLHYLHFDVLVKQISYKDLFIHYTHIDPFQTSKSACFDYLQQNNKLAVGVSLDDDLDMLLQLIMSEIIEPQLPSNQATLVYDYPTSQSALAQLAVRDYATVAERFELYIGSVECGNGFHELQDAAEQLTRFEENRLTRKQNNAHDMQIDDKLIKALEHGLPDCSGIAIGLDRLFMLKNNIPHIQQSIF